MRDIPPLKFGLDDKGCDAGPRGGPVAEAGQEDQLEALNGRRLRLIEKKLRGGLSPAEEGDLAALECQVDRLMHERFPHEQEVLARQEEFERRLDAEGVPP